jgi:hypothetical protein
MPMNLPRSRWSGTAWLISASVVGSSAAAPTPARACPAQTASIERAHRAVTAPATENSRPAWNTFLRPWTSPKTPAVRMNAAIGSTNASCTHDS